MTLIALVAALLAPTPVGVAEREWRVSLYRSQVLVGVVRLNAHNFGEDGHDLSVRTRTGKVLASLPELRPGETGTLRVRLRRPARYVVFCSLAGHEARGMHAVLRVKRRPAASTRLGRLRADRPAASTRLGRLRADRPAASTRLGRVRADRQ